MFRTLNCSTIRPAWLRNRLHSSSRLACSLSAMLLHLHIIVRRQCQYPSTQMSNPDMAASCDRLAFFLAVDFHSLFPVAMRAAAYLIPYYILATPNAALWQMYIVCVGIVYACTGTGYLLSLVNADHLTCTLWS